MGVFFCLTLSQSQFIHRLQWRGTAVRIIARAGRLSSSLEAGPVCVPTIVVSSSSSSSSFIPFIFLFLAWRGSFFLLFLSRWQSNPQQIVSVVQELSSNLALQHRAGKRWTKPACVHWKLAVKSLFVISVGVKSCLEALFNIVVRALLHDALWPYMNSDAIQMSWNTKRELANVSRWNPDYWGGHILSVAYTFSHTIKIYQKSLNKSLLWLQCQYFQS